METPKPRSTGSKLLRIALFFLGTIFGVGLIMAAGVYWKLNSLSHDAVGIVTRPSAATGLSVSANPTSTSGSASQPGAVVQSGIAGQPGSTNEIGQPSQAVATSPGSA